MYLVESILFVAHFLGELQIEVQRLEFATGQCQVQGLRGHPAAAGLRLTSLWALVPVEAQDPP